MKELINGTIEDVIVIKNDETVFYHYFERLALECILYHICGAVPKF